jgi:sulfur carrier protein
MHDTAAPATITIRTDQGPVQLPAGSTVADALQNLSLNAQQAASMATAVNGDFVARHARSQHVLRDGDALLCFTAITGG